MAFWKKITTIRKRIYIFLVLAGFLITIISSDLNIVDENDGAKNIQLYSGLTRTVFSFLVKEKDGDHSIQLGIFRPCKWDEENKKYVLSEEGS